MGTISKFYSQEVKKYYKPLSKEEEERLLTQYQSSRDPEALDKIIKSVLAMVLKLAQKYSTLYGVSVDDLIQEGNSVLIHAVSKYQPDKNSRWSTYAFYWIKKEMIDYIRKYSKSVYLPIAKVKEVNNYSENGLLSSDPNFSQYYHLYHMGSLQQVYDSNMEEELTLENIIQSPEKTPEEQVIQQEQKELFHQVLKSNLTASEYDLFLKVVLDGMTFRKLAKERKVSPERIRQIYLKITKKLQKVKLQLSGILGMA